MLQQDWLEDLFQLGRITAEEYVTEIDRIREGLLLQIAEIDQALARVKGEVCPECSGLRIPCEHCGNSGWGEGTQVIETKETKETKETPTLAGIMMAALEKIRDCPMTVDEMVDEAGHAIYCVINGFRPSKLTKSEFNIFQ